jgi:hypothetical protein
LGIYCPFLPMIMKQPDLRVLSQVPGPAPRGRGHTRPIGDAPVRGACHTGPAPRGRGHTRPIGDAPVGGACHTGPRSTGPGAHAPHTGRTIPGRTTATHPKFGQDVAFNAFTSAGCRPVCVEIYRFGIGGRGRRTSSAVGNWAARPVLPGGPTSPLAPSHRGAGASIVPGKNPWPPDLPAYAEFGNCCEERLYWTSRPFI